jgi:adenine deaminase
MVRGVDLNAYIAAGIESDHECTTAEEALEKLGLGMRVMIREGSAAKNVTDLLPMVTEGNSRRCFFVTDDRHPADLLRDGHIDHILRKAVAAGLDPLTAVRMASLHTAEYFGLKKRAAIAPGYLADMVVVDDLKDFRVDTVIKSGRTVVRDGSVAVDFSSYTSEAVLGTVHLPDFSERDVRIPARGKRARVIGLVEGQIWTRTLLEEVRTQSGEVVSDTDRDILKLAVVERHQGTGNIGLGLVSGFGLQTGALASSVAHDSHNVIVVGVEDRDMIGAVREVGRMGGGFVVFGGGHTIASLPLPIAGLISDQPLQRVCDQLDAVHVAAQKLGATAKNPFTILSFLALPVIPELKLTDKGLVDVNAFQIIDLFE